MSFLLAGNHTTGVEDPIHPQTALEVSRFDSVCRQEQDDWM